LFLNDNQKQKAKKDKLILQGLDGREKKEHVKISH